MLRVIAVLLLIPILDVLLLVVLTGFVGWPLVILAVVLTALVGLFLVRAEGRHTLRKIQEKLARGEAPTDELIDGGLLLVSGGFLLTPGLVTDLVGLLLVVPLTRYPIRLAVKRFVVVPYVDAKTGGFASGNVYVGGFPDGAGEGQGQGGSGGPGRRGGEEVHDLDDEDYDVDDR
jgi:UPF0716 protein FxsA